MANRNRSAAAALIVTGIVLAGCGGKHFRYTDLQSERIYYAKGGKVDNQRGGAITFTDAVTGRTVTLQSFEREKISKSEFKTATEPAGGE